MDGAHSFEDGERSLKDGALCGAFEGEIDGSLDGLLACFHDSEFDPCCSLKGKME